MTNTFDRFAPKGVAIGNSNGFGGRVVEDNRKPIYLVLILDTSNSMNETSEIITETGETKEVTKIEQLNEGMRKVIKSLKDFEKTNPLYKVYLQVIELNSYGKELFNEFQPLSRGFEEIKFEASGCTVLRASLTTLKDYISQRHLRDERQDREGKGYNKAVSVILMSDGWPTDNNGITQNKEAYRGVVDDFKKYLMEMDYERSVDLYSIAVGDDACEDMLRYFCDGSENLGDNSRFYRVEACESIASALDYLTRATLAHHTTVPVANDDSLYDDDDDEDDDEDYISDDLDENDDDLSTADPDATTENDSNDSDDSSNDGDSDDGNDSVDDDDSDDDNDDTDDDNSTNTSSIYQIDIYKCRKDRCMECVKDKCPTQAIEVHSGIISINPDKCNGCGECLKVCPYEAVQSVETDQQLDDLFDGLDE